MTLACLWCLGNALNQRWGFLEALFAAGMFNVATQPYIMAVNKQAQAELGWFNYALLALLNLALWVIGIVAFFAIKSELSSLWDRWRMRRMSKIVGVLMLAVFASTLIGCGNTGYLHGVKIAEVCLDKVHASKPGVHTVAARIAENSGPLAYWQVQEVEGEQCIRIRLYGQVNTLTILDEEAIRDQTLRITVRTVQADGSLSPRSGTFELQPGKSLDKEFRTVLLVRGTEDQVPVVRFK